ncbi:unnamed protein product [Periconia digitata]|uniref:Uncharacterized protein n=1 Tax=Periconia digitata TaxID=1303443 RepID=A0A9W4U7Q4_9PLEO|nr:unnamed protein product [Periconia digitata]
MDKKTTNNTWTCDRLIPSHLEADLTHPGMHPREIVNTRHEGSRYYQMDWTPKNLRAETSLDAVVVAKYNL